MSSHKNMERISLFLVLVFGGIFPKYQSAGSCCPMFMFGGLCLDTESHTPATGEPMRDCTMQLVTRLSFSTL